MKTRMLFTLSLGVILFMTMAFVSVRQGTPWVVPDNYKTMKNPVKFDKAAAATLYTTHCKSCHGKEGLGDGPKAAQLDTKCGDFSSAAFQKQSDGAIFYKTLEGRKDMPSFKKKIPDQNDLWQLVAYLRTMAE